MGIEIGDRRDLPDDGRAGPPAKRQAPAVRRFTGGMEAEAQAYVSMLRRRSRLIRTVLLVVVGLALLYTLSSDPIYRASALVEIRGGGGDDASVEQLFAGDEPSEEQLRTYLGLLRSSSLASDVVRGLRLDTLEEFNADGDAEAQEIVEEFLERLVVDPVEESRLVRVSFDAGSPEVSKRIVDAILDHYILRAVRLRDRTAERLALQLDSVGGRLADAEQALRDYAEANQLPYSPEEDLSAQISQRMSDLRQRLAEARAARYEDESRYDVIVQEGRPELVDDPIRDELSLRLSELRRDYARLSATFTDAFPMTSDLQRQIDHLRGLIEEEEQRIARGVESDYRLAQQREQRLADAIAETQEQANTLGAQSGEYHLLRQAVLTNRQLYATLDQKQREAEIAAAIGPTNLEIVDAAVAPAEPYRPVFAMNMGLAMMLGIVLALIAAFVKELLDDTVQAAEDVSVVGGSPVLAMIPTVPSQEEQTPQWVGAARRAKGVLPWPGLDERDSAAADPRLPERPGWPRIDAPDGGDPRAKVLRDAFGTLRTSVLFKDGDRRPRSILVSSCRAGEGKTTVSVNLAMSLSRLGHRVLLVDADLRRPAVNEALGLAASPGLSLHLSGESDWRPTVRKDVVDHLDVLTSGSATADAADLLTGDAMGKMIREAEEEYPFVIVDAPALFINASDARLLAREVDGVVVVVRSRSTPRSLVDRIPEAAPNLLGVVVNDLRESNLPEYYGDYFTEYGDADTEGVGGVARWTREASEITATIKKITNWSTKNGEEHK